jgi:hypothetical protein
LKPGGKYRNHYNVKNLWAFSVNSRHINYLIIAQDDISTADIENCHKIYGN